MWPLWGTSASFLICYFVFSVGIATLPLTLTLKPGAEPVLGLQKRLPIRPQVQTKQKLHRLVYKGVPVPVDEPTDWLNQMIVATKKDGRLRISIDPRSLDLALMRKHCQFPVLEHIPLGLAVDCSTIAPTEIAYIADDILIYGVGDTLCEATRYPDKNRTPVHHCWNVARNTWLF